AKGLLVIKRPQGNLRLDPVKGFLQALAVGGCIGQRCVFPQTLPRIAKVKEQCALAFQAANATHGSHLRLPEEFPRTTWPSAVPCRPRCSPRCRASCARRRDGCSAALPAGHCPSGDPG